MRPHYVRREQRLQGPAQGHLPAGGGLHWEREQTPGLLLSEFGSPWQPVAKGGNCQVSPGSSQRLL